MPLAVMPNPFVFVRIRFVHSHYTDNRAGSPMYYVALLLKGNAKIVSSKTTLEIRPGDVFFIPKQLPYQSYWSGQEEIEFLSYGFLQTQARESLRFGLQVVDCGEALKKEIAQIPTEGASPGCEALSRFYGVLARLLPALQKSSPFSRRDEIVQQAQNYISTHPECTVSEIARACYISTPYLHQLFREKIGCGPNQFRLQLKCQRGIEYLMTTDKTVEEISGLAGFCSPAHFRRQLKLQTGLTPREIRKSNGF